ncbi:transposase (plasmid) [Sinorhizobium americanum]|uniref:Transposase n=1 Tax=Sinorhizobium americanum TaxID=194963 RepID=A0A1L3LTN1_9HYPH|nr:transposase [Sinorhizobium americanum]
MWTDYPGQTVPVIDPTTGVIFSAQIFVAVLGDSNLTFAFVSFSQKLPDWIDGQVRALACFGGVTKAIVCNNLEGWDRQGAVVRADAEREGAVLIVERWILARLRKQDVLLAGRAQYGDRRTARGVEQPADAPRWQKPPRAVRGDRADSLEAAAGDAVRIRGMEIGEGPSRVPRRDR